MLEYGSILYSSAAPSHVNRLDSFFFLFAASHSLF